MGTPRGLSATTGLLLSPELTNSDHSALAMYETPEIWGNAKGAKLQQSNMARTFESSRQNWPPAKERMPWIPWKTSPVR
jgi:hypothetical protein